MALAAVSYMKALLGRVLNEERAQDAFEYLLVIGAISTAVIIAITTVGFATMADGVIDGVCGAIDLLPNMPAITCT